MIRGRPSRGDVYLGDDDAPSLMRRYSAPTIAVVVFSLFSAIVWYSYNQGAMQGTDVVAPYIRAESVATKRKPEQPGGDIAPHEGIYVYNPVGPNVDPPAVERLLPPPETPLPRPIPVINVSPSPPALPQIAKTPPAPAVVPKAERTPPDNRARAPAPKPQSPPEDMARSPAPKPESPLRLQADIKRILEDLQVPKLAPAAGLVADRQAVAAPQVAAIAPQAARAWWVQVASMGTRDAAERAWSAIRRAHANTLDSLEAKFRTAEIAGRGTFYRVQAGPLRDEAAARAVCDALKAREQGCLVVPPER